MGTITVADHDAGTIYETAPAAYLPEANRVGGGGIWISTPITADTIVADGAAVFKGIFCTAAGTMAAVYDNIAASGQVLLASQVGVANTFYGIPNGSVAAKTGIYCDWTSGTWYALWA